MSTFGSYASDRSGRREVYVRPYPGPEPATHVSRGPRAENPSWSPDGRRLYYVEQKNPGPGLVWVSMAVDVVPETPLRVGRPVPLIDAWPWTAQPTRGCDVFPDGSFINAVPEPADSLYDPGETELRVILNFSELLRDRVGS